jgi:hypothetical protein
MLNGGATLDEHLPELAAAIVGGVGIDPPEVKARLEPPRLRIVKGAPDALNSFCVPSDSGVIILVGGELYRFFHHYTAAAATYLVPAKSGGAVPSRAWPEACSSLATTFDWACSPAATPIYPPIELTPYQASSARAFGSFAYRFALCHELAHVALGHVGRDVARQVVVNDVAVYRASQKDETEADQYGLELQVKSLANRLLAIPALTSSVHFIYGTGLMDGKLGLLSELVDYRAWQIPYSHPPALGRVFQLARAAEGFQAGMSEALFKVHEGLSPMNLEVWNRADDQRDAVAKAVRHLVRKGASGDALAPLLRRSPTGVVLGLEVTRKMSEATVRAKDRLAESLPEELQTFRRQSKTERARSATGHISHA